MKILYEYFAKYHHVFKGNLPKKGGIHQDELDKILLERGHNRRQVILIVSYQLYLLPLCYVGNRQKGSTKTTSETRAWSRKQKKVYLKSPIVFTFVKLHIEVVSLFQCCNMFMLNCCNCLCCWFQFNM